MTQIPVLIDTDVDIDDWMAILYLSMHPLVDLRGLTITGVSDVIEGQQSRPPVPVAKAERMTLAADIATPVEAGLLEVTVPVSVTFRAG